MLLVSAATLTHSGSILLGEKQEGSGKYSKNYMY
jgi:hypothetical protein